MINNASERRPAAVFDSSNVFLGCHGTGEVENMPVFGASFFPLLHTPPHQCFLNLYTIFFPFQVSMGL
jgi:hypothetical protein